MSLSPLRKEQRRCLEIAARDGQLVAGPDTPYKLTFCRALVRKGYLEGNLTSKGLTPFTITSAGRQALEEQTTMNHGFRTAALPIHPEPTPEQRVLRDWRNKAIELEIRLETSHAEVERLKAGITAHIQTRLYGDGEDWHECLECEKWAIRPDLIQHADDCSIKALVDLLK